MGPDEIIEFLSERKLLEADEVLDLTLRELYLMLDYFCGVRPREHRPLG